MTLRNSLLQNKSYKFENNVFYQSGFERSGNFEETYIALREKEGRLYDDEALKLLPEVAGSHSLTKEWELRKVSLKRLVNFSNQEKKPHFILELGCGNGWLSHNLVTSLDSEVCGMDVNETELRQGGRVFRDVKNLSFVYGDIFKVDFKPLQFDTIILASSIQYFPNLNLFLNRLLELLKPSGKIFIMDCPFYSSPSKADAARKRSVDYFQSIGFPEMGGQYFHHTLQELKGFSFRILYNPSSVIALTQRKFFKIALPVFPIIQIKHA